MSEEEKLRKVIREDRSIVQARFQPTQNHRGPEILSDDVENKSLTTITSDASSRIKENFANNRPEGLVYAAYKLWQQNYRIVALRGKQPLTKWEHWQRQPQTREEFNSSPWEQADGFAVICGVQLESGHYVAAIDLDVERSGTDLTEQERQKQQDFIKKLTPVTAREKTPSGGLHLIFLSHSPVKTRSFPCGIEVLGEGKLCIMAPSKGYSKLNDNTPSEIENLNAKVEKALLESGIQTPKPKITTAKFKSKPKKQKRQKPRYCIKKTLSLGQDLSGMNGHLMRLAIAAELKRCGFTENEIIQEFSKLPGFDGQKTKTQVESADPSRVAGCETIKEYGFCYPECSDRKWTGEEALDYELEILKAIELHPLIDYHPETGLTIGTLLQTSKKFLQIINLSPKIVDFEEPLLSELSSQSVSVKQLEKCVLRRDQKEMLVNIAKALNSGKKIQNEDEKALGNFALEKVSHYWYHSDSRWHIFVVCLTIVTYLHRLFSVLGHSVFQGVRGSGKSTVGMLLSQIAWNPTKLQLGLREAPLFRSIENSRPTHIADLTKISFKHHDLIDLYEVIDPDGVVRRCVGENFDPVDFYVFCVKVLLVRQSVPFTDKCIVCITEPAPKGSEYTERRRFIRNDPELKELSSRLLKSALFSWSKVLDLYNGLKQDSKLFGRRFDLWRPFLAVCKIYVPDKFEELLSLAYEDAQQSEKGDATSEVESALLVYFSDFEGDSKTFSLKDMTEATQTALSKEVVKDYHIVQSALKNLGIIKRKTHTREGVKYLIDLTKIPELLKERQIKLENNQEKTCSLNDLVSVRWVEEPLARHECGVCGYERETSWKAITTKNVDTWICEPCVQQFESQRKVS